MRKKQARYDENWPYVGAGWMVRNKGGYWFSKDGATWYDRRGGIVDASSYHVVDSRTGDVINGNHIHERRMP